MEASGKNRTPDKLQKEERDKLFKICDPYLQLMVEQLEPEFVVGVGRFAKIVPPQPRRLRREDCPNTPPSPASPWANKDWWGTVQKQMKDQEIWP